MSLTVASATFTRYADGSLHIVNRDAGEMKLSQSEAAELGNYLIATAGALRAVQAAIAAASIAAAEQEIINEAQAGTEVIP
jgi:microcompartment protein CcmL/EutN